MMHSDRAGLEKEVIAIISEISGFEASEISPDARFFEDLEIDSIKAIEVTVAIEKKFKVAIRDEDVPKITTVREATEMLDGLLAGNR
jgi:acyl carrier protein